MPYLMQIIGIEGMSTPFDGEYLVEYDPSRNSFDPDGMPMLAHVVTTKNPSRAKRYENLEAIHAEWTRVDPRQPVRPDGQPNRPLTAFTISTVQAPVG
jgi:hypothetical protein